MVEFNKPKNQMNFTVEVVEDALWSGLEITLGIINACLPVIQPAAQRVFNAPYLQLISFSTSRFSKKSKRSTGYRATSSHSRFLLWARLISSKDESKAGIEREVGYSADTESNASHRIPMESMGSTTKLAGQNPMVYHDPLKNH